MNPEKSIKVLNSIIEINNKRIEIYKIAEKATEENDLKQLFSEFLEVIRVFKLELIQEVEKLGGIPVDVIKRNSLFSRIWVNYKSIFAETNREDLLNTLEYDEFLAINRYKNTLLENENDLTINLHFMLKTHYRMLNSRHDKIKELGDLMLINHKYDKSFTF